MTDCVICREKIVGRFKNAKYCRKCWNAYNHGYMRGYNHGLRRKEIEEDVKNAS